MQWKKLLSLVLGVLALAATTEIASAEKIIKPNEGDIIPGPFTEWKIVDSYVYTINYGPWVEEVRHTCYTTSCSVKKTISHCSETVLWGTVKVSKSEIKAEVGFSIGKEDCESISCSATCNYGETLVLYWRYRQPVYKIIQRKYIVDGFGREYATDEYAYAYARQEWTPECKSIATR